MTCTPSVFLEGGIQSIPCQSQGNRRTAEMQTEGHDVPSQRASVGRTLILWPRRCEANADQGRFFKGVIAVSSALHVSPASELNWLRCSAGCGVVWDSEARIRAHGIRVTGTGEPEGVLRGSQGQPQAGTGCRRGHTLFRGRPCTDLHLHKEFSDSNTVFQLAEWPPPPLSSILQGYSSCDSEGTQRLRLMPETQTGKTHLISVLAKLTTEYGRWPV